MAQWDAADCLAQLRALLKRPSVDEDATDAQLYLWLGQAQIEWMGILAAIVPEINYSAPELMTTADSGATYTTASYPLGHMEVRESRSGPLLIPGPDWSEASDYTQEGQTIRMPSGRTRVFSAGPYARYVKTPGLLNASNAPTLKPPHALALVVTRAAIIYCLAGGYRDPSPYLLLEQRQWAGDPGIPGDTGILGSLKTQNMASGAAAVMSPYNRAAWWRNSPDLG